MATLIDIITDSSVIHVHVVVISIHLAFYASVGGATQAYGSLFVCVSGAESRKPLKTKR